MNLQSTARAYGTALRASYRSTRARLMGDSEHQAAAAAELGDPQVQTVGGSGSAGAPATDAGHSTPDPVAPLALSLSPDLARLVDAVAEEIGLSRELVMTDFGSDRAAAARKLAAALAVRRLGRSRAHAAQAFAILEPAVRAGLRHLDRVLIEHAVPVGGDLSATIRLVVAHCGLDQPPRPTIGEIKRVVAAVFAVTRAELESSQRHLPLVAVRQLAMALAKRLCSRSLSEIGRQFGGRDHTTVLHAVRKMAPLLEAAAARVGPSGSVDEWVRAARAVMEAPP